MSKKTPCPAVSPSEPAPFINARTRKAIARKARQQRARKGKPANVPPEDERQIAKDVHVYTDDSYIDKRKKVFTQGMAAVKERVAAINAKFQLPARIETACRPLYRFLRLFRKDYTRVLLINRDGRAREFLPDKPGDHRLLCHRAIARHLISHVCMLVRITAAEDEDGQPLDGSWAIVPAQYSMMRTTTIQHLRRRPLWFLRRYWYEISFDGRVQPAHLLFDYGLNPEARRTRLFVTHEYVPVRKQDATNDYFRFWHNRPKR